jgi:hypothetical protein
MTSSDIKQAINRMRNLGIAHEHMAEAYKFWSTNFPTTSLCNVLEKSQSNGSLDDVLVTMVTDAQIDDVGYGASMLMAVITCEMGFG